MDFLGGTGGVTNQVHVLQVGGESKIKSSCRRLLAGQRWTHSAGAGLHGCAGICWRLGGSLQAAAASACFPGICTCWAFLLVVFIFCIIFLPVGDDGCQSFFIFSFVFYHYYHSNDNSNNRNACWSRTRKHNKEDKIVVAAVNKVWIIKPEEGFDSSELAPRPAPQVLFFSIGRIAVLLSGATGASYNKTWSGRGFEASKCSSAWLSCIFHTETRALLVTSKTGSIYFYKCPASTLLHFLVIWAASQSSGVGKYRLRLLTGFGCTVLALP